MQDVHEGSDILNQRGIEAEKIRLARDDGQSVLLWVDQLRKDGDLLAFKSSADAVPKDSGLDEDAFVLAMQTPYQREVFEKYGHAFAGLDATHNTTHYVNTSLFTIIVRDRWGHGKPDRIHMRAGTDLFLSKAAR